MKATRRPRGYVVQDGALEWRNNERSTLHPITVERQTSALARALRRVAAGVVLACVLLAVMWASRWLG